jgi:hypothetical protein
MSQIAVSLSAQAVSPTQGLRLVVGELTGVESLILSIGHGGSGRRSRTLKKKKVAQLNQVATDGGLNHIRNKFLPLLTTNMPSCGYCRASFSTGGVLRRHQKQSAICKAQIEAHLGTPLARLTSMRNRGNRASEDQTQRANSPVDDVGLTLDSIPFESDLPVQPDLAVPEPSDQDAQVPTADSGAADSRLPNGLPRWSEQLDPRLLAGATHGPGKTFFEIIHNEEILKEGMVLGPFRDNDEWELAKWLIKHVGHTATQEFLKLPIVSSWYSERQESTYRS